MNKNMSTYSKMLSQTPTHPIDNLETPEDKKIKREQPNQLQKYQIIKLTSSGDYVCNDNFGNNYLLVYQHLQSGVYEFQNAALTNFQRNSTNRALLTPFEDIDHGGLKFTAYILPERSVGLSDSLFFKNKQQIDCLSLVYSLINKVLKPLINIFGANAHKWLHIQNIWIKQRNIFYILSERRKKSSNNSKQSLDNIFNIEKNLLRKLSCGLLPYFKIEPELKSFLSVFMDALMNGQLNIDQACSVLKDKSRRKSFVEQKKEKQISIDDENNDILYNSFKTSNKFWGKRKLYAPESQRPSLVSQTLNIQTQQRLRNEVYKRQIKRIGETIQVPPSLSTKRNSVSHSRNRMFDFKDKSKKRKSLSSQKSRNFNRSIEGNPISTSENIQIKLKSFIKNSQTSKFYSVNIRIQENAYQRFKQQLQVEKISSSRYKSFSIVQEDKKLRTLLEQRSAEKSKKNQTIDVGERNRFRVKSISNQPLSLSQKPKQQKEKDHNNMSNQHQNEYISQQTIKLNERQIKFNNDLIIQKKVEEILKQKQLEQQKIRQRQIQKEEQIQRAKQQLRQKQLQIEREKQMQRQKQKQEKQKLERQRAQKQRLEKQVERLKLKQQEALKQKQKIAKTVLSNQIISQKKKQTPTINEQTQNLAKKRSESTGAFKKSQIGQNIQSVNLDDVEMVQSKTLAQLQAIKKAEQAEKLKNQKNNKPPLPVKTKITQTRKNQSDQQIQQINLSNNKKGQPQIIEKPAKKNETERPQLTAKTNENQNKKQPEFKREKSESDSHQRTKTLGSEIASSCGPKKPVSKQVAQYMHMINKMGESVAKSSRISSKLEDVEWFTGIYFVYKRFLFQRKKIEKWLQNKTPNLTRYQEKNKQQWDQWFKSEQKKSLQEKIKIENENIVTSIMKMNKKIMKKSLPGNFLFHAALSRHSQQESKIAVSEVVKQFDFLQQKEKLNDEDIITHINDLLNSLYIMAQLDGKIEQKKPLIQILKKKNAEQLSDFSDFIYDLYIKE